MQEFDLSKPHIPLDVSVWVANKITSFFVWKKETCQTGFAYQTRVNRKTTHFDLPQMRI
jgi:hypothetical protein